MRRWLVFVAILAGSAPAFASDEPGLDLILLIDRSRSMSRVRVDALPVLAAELLEHNAAANRVTHRVGVITFASEACVEVPLSAVRKLTWSAPKAGGHTDALAAFTAVAAQFRSVASDASRRRAIVVVTDGITNVPGRDGREYAEALRRFVATQFAGTTIDVLLVRGNAERELWRELSSNRVHETNELPATLHRVVTALAGTRVTESVDEVVLPPYLDVVVFDVIGHRRDNEVAVFPPGAARPLEFVHVTRLGDALATIVVQRPAPGAWTFRNLHDASGVRVFSQQFFPRGMLVTPGDAEPLRQHDRVAVAYRVIDANSAPLVELSGYPLTLDLEFATPNGTRSLAAMTPRPDLGPSTFAAKETACDLPGRYWTEVRLSTRDARGLPVEVFRDRWSGFSVEEATPVDCRLQQPTVTWGRVDARIDCGPDVGPRTATAFRASLRRNGKHVPNGTTFRYLGNGSFAGAVRGAALPGSYTLRLCVDRSRNVRIVPAERTFDRTIRWPAVVLLLLSALLSVWRLTARRRSASANRVALHRFSHALMLSTMTATRRPSFSIACHARTTTTASPATHPSVTPAVPARLPIFRAIIPPLQQIRFAISQGSGRITRGSS